MYIDTAKELLFSDNPSVIGWMVEQALADGKDLCADPFVCGGNFCQWVTLRKSVLEYKLISAFLPGDFAAQVAQMTAQGYELALRPVDWNGMTFQWMARIRDIRDVFSARAGSDGEMALYMESAGWRK